MSFGERHQKWSFFFFFGVVALKSFCYKGIFTTDSCPRMAAHKSGVRLCRGWSQTFWKHLYYPLWPGPVALDWGSAMFGLPGRDWSSLFQRHTCRSISWCPYWVANESCVWLYFVAAFLVLNSSHSGSIFAGSSRPPITAHARAASPGEKSSYLVTGFVIKFVDRIWV